MVYSRLHAKKTFKNIWLNFPKILTFQSVVTSDKKRKWVVKIIFNTLCVYFYVQEQLFTYVQVQIFDNFSAGFSTDNF